MLFQVVQYSVEDSGGCVVHRPVCSVLVGVQGGWQGSLDVSQDKTLQALHNDRCQCHGPVSLRDVTAACFGAGTIVDVFRQVGTLHCDRKRLKSFENTSPDSAAQPLRTRPGCNLGPLLSVG